MSRNQWHIGVHQRHLMFKGHCRAPHETIYGHKKKVWLDENISIGSFHASFHNVSIYVKSLQKVVMYCQADIISSPVGTLSPICSSDIVTDWPFSRVTFDRAGKQGSSHLQQYRAPFESKPEHYNKKCRGVLNSLNFVPIHARLDWFCHNIKAFTPTQYKTVKIHRIKDSSRVVLLLHHSTFIVKSSLFEATKIDEMAK